MSKIVCSIGIFLFAFSLFLPAVQFEFTRVFSGIECFVLGTMLALNPSPARGEAPLCQLSLVLYFSLMMFVFICFCTKGKYHFLNMSMMILLMGFFVYEFVLIHYFWDVQIGYHLWTFSFFAGGGGIGVEIFSSGTDNQVVSNPVGSFD